ncbi:MAG TPA: tetratricopeptide repeat protein [Opitutaceae bacterium]|jgi:predicted O-linked N-acetylglucosamine transferase (SPINDLY family)|nr:tetratricopeptide repeat protein [Opitutaceae bacterium]
MLSPGTETVRPAAALLEQGRELRGQGRAEEAIAAFREALALEPNLAEAHHQLGNALKALRRYAEAVPCLRSAALLAPENAAVWLNLGVACLELGWAEEAVARFRRAVELEPFRPDARNVLGHALLVQGRCAEARRQLEEALRLRPGYAAAHDNLGRVLKAQGRATEAIAHHRAAIEAQPKAEIHSNLLFSLNFPAELDPEDVWAEHRRWAQLYAEPLRAAGEPPAHNFEPERRLRIGYVSPDFVNHAVAYFFEPALAARDRKRFEVTCYSDARVPDAVTERLRAQSDRWRDLAGRSDEEAAALMRADGIDLLVDLAGHTARHRLLTFARRPAPVQVSWLGYPNTTGLAAIDYRLTEAVCDPPGVTDAWHSEKLLRLPGPFSCYRPPAEAPPVAPLPAAASGRITFGCFNHAAKLVPAVVQLWAEVLGWVPGSRLLLRSHGWSDPETAVAMLARFAEHGIGPERIELDGSRLSLAAHLESYRRVDIALDPFPYNGTTTTCEALWMGVPVVALVGGTHRARVGASLLTHLGSPEWIAANPAGYVAICRSLAGAPADLGEIRAGLRERMRTGPLCDAAGFARRLEGAFREMWRERCARARPGAVS